MTNAEAATRLFVTPKTIEFHLSNAYRKLGLRSRAELAGVVAGLPRQRTDPALTGVAHADVGARE